MIRVVLGNEPWVCGKMRGRGSFLGVVGESRLDSLQLLLGTDGRIHSFLSYVLCGFLS